MPPMSTSAMVKPIPMPRPSKAESSTLFLLAKASARPSTMQFTTINGMNTPRLADSAGRNPWINRSIMLTKVAMMTI